VDWSGRGRIGCIMYLFHIKPIPPDRAERQIADVYNEIIEALHITTVPLVFQYTANYPQYFFYLWERILANLASSDFHNSVSEMKEIAYQTVAMLPTPTPPLRNMVEELHPSERYAITEIVNLLDDANIRLMLLTIAIRESLKGIPHVKLLLPDEQNDIEQHLDSVWQIERLALQGAHDKELTEATRMLAPLFGKNTLMISHYPDFFANVAHEMDQLKNMPAYLHLRVELEHLALERIDRFDVPLECSFVDFMRMTEGQAYTDELIFLLKDTFPSHFPHLMLTTAVMKNALAAKSGSIIPQ
jgi:Halocarboxylic acid dehydrogenase DehI